MESTFRASVSIPRVRNPRSAYSTARGRPTYPRPTMPMRACFRAIFSLSFISSVVVDGFSLFVLAGDPVAVLPGHHPPPPAFVLPVPPDRVADPLLERHGRCPAQLPPDLRAVDGVAAVVRRPVGDERDQLLPLSQLPQDQAHDIDVAPLAAAPDVVHFARNARLHHADNGAGVIGGVDPVPHVPPVTVHRERN